MNTMQSIKHEEESPSLPPSLVHGAAAADEMAVASMTSTGDAHLDGPQQHWQQQVFTPPPQSQTASTSILSRASKLGSDTYSAAKRFTGDHIHVPRIPYISSSTSGRNSPSSSSQAPSSSTRSATRRGSSSPAPVSTSEEAGLLAREPSLKPYDHREKTALHALRDTFVLPSFPTGFLPNHIPLPSIPCMGGLGQSHLFSESPDSAVVDDAEADNLASSTSSSGGKDLFKRLSGNVLMMGGYRGSILRDASTGRRLWVPLRVGFNVRKADLAIGLTTEDERNTRETVVPGKSLAAIAGFVDLGKRLKDRLKSLHNEGQLSFHGWGYDWRRSLHFSSAELVAYLEAVKAETGEGTLVFSHSMGGLVALHALARAKDPSIFTGIIFGSTPFGGTPNILQPFKYGDSILFNKEVCSPSTVFSFRSSFYLLPPDGLCFYRSSDTSAMQMNFLDAGSWTRAGLSPMTAKLLSGSPEERKEERREAETADDATAGDGGNPLSVPQMGSTASAASDSAPSSSTSQGFLSNRRSSGSSGSTSAGESHDGLGSNSRRGSTANPDESSTKGTAQVASDPTIMSYLTRTLGEVSLFREELSTLYDPAKRDAYPPLVLLSSRKTPTVKGCVVNDVQEIVEGKYDRLLFGEGDGIILHRSAQAIPDVWKPHIVGNFESSNGHVSLLSDLPVISKALDAIDQANAKRKG